MDLRDGSLLLNIAQMSVGYLNYFTLLHEVSESFAQLSPFCHLFR